MRAPSLAVAGSAVLVLILAAAVLAGARPPAAALTNCDIDANSVALTSNEQEFINLLNDYREDHGVHPLAISPTLTRAAAWMAHDMATNVGLSHQDSLGRQPWTRAFDCGYPTLAVGENASALGPDAGYVFYGFTQSPGHNANMLGSDWVAIGVGHEAGLWSIKFGAVDDSDTPPPTAAPTSTATSTPSPTYTPTPTATASPTATATATPTTTPTASPTSTPTPAPTAEVFRAFAPLAAKGE